MSKWITGKDLIRRWELQPFELFTYLKQGLQAYHKDTGKKIIDSDSLPRAKRDSLDTIEKNLRAKQNARVLGGPDNPIGPPASDYQIEQTALRIYNSQSLEIIHPPKDCVLVSFNLSIDSSKAKEQINNAMTYLFKLKDINEFENIHPELTRAIEQKQADQEVKISTAQTFKVSRVQRDRKQVRAITEGLLKLDPNLRIKDIANHPSIEAIHSVKGKPYVYKTIREWTHDLKLRGQMNLGLSNK